jgi:DNA-binding NtrC family response regulator
MSAARIAVLDDEPRMVEVLAMVLRSEGHEVDPFSSAEAALAAVGETTYDLLITDLKMPGPDGLDVLRRARAARPGLPVVLLTAHATVATAVAALREGAFDYVEKPFDNDALRALVERALETSRLARENRYLRAEVRSRYAPDAMVTESPRMKEALDLARRAAASRSTVLVTGESGTGKELVARAVHFLSDRVGGPFVAANCKAFAPGVLESELFGHERGAFTGADRSRAGLFERADGGTLFLDEIGEVGPDFQAKLLRVLQERSVVRVGGAQERRVDVRLVAATNRDLRAEIASGRFREDLYFRLAVIPIQLPPLRERPEDVLPLARHFLAKWSRERERSELSFAPEVEAWLVRQRWPGNVRELENAIERGVVLARGACIGLDDLLVDERAEGPAAAAPAGVAPGSASGQGLQAFLDEAAAQRIRVVLAECGGTRVEAARRLGIDRATLYRLMRRYGITEEPGAGTA